MHPSKVDRTRLSVLTDLPNIGKAIAKDFQVLGIERPSQLTGLCPFTLYRMLCEKTGVRHDPCIIDVFISVTRFLAGEAARPWWDYTAERKQRMAQSVQP